LEIVRAWWCYPIERYLAVVKHYVHNKAKHEGYMAKPYVWWGLWILYQIPFIIWTHKEDVGPRQIISKCRWSFWKEVKTKNIEWHGITYGPWICVHELCGNPRPNSVSPNTHMLSKL
jgi:hypothetical protein